MAKFRYYITDLFQGVVVGSNSKDLAAEFAICEDFFVIDTETNEWWVVSENSPDGIQRLPIEERKPYPPPSIT